MSITTTLSAIRKHHPCEDVWEKLLAGLGKTKADDEPLEMVRILESNGIEDAIWCLRSLGPEHHKLIVSLACDFAERSLRYVPEGETRPAECLRITRLWVEGAATLEEVRAAANAADAAYDAYAAEAAEAADAAYDAYAADAVYAADAADAAEAAYAAYAAYAVADAAARAAAYAVADVAANAAYAAADDAERVWQTERFVEAMRTN